MHDFIIITVSLSRHTCLFFKSLKNNNRLYPLYSLYKSINQFHLVIFLLCCFSFFFLLSSIVIEKNIKNYGHEFINIRNGFYKNKWFSSFPSYQFFCSYGRITLFQMSIPIYQRWRTGELMQYHLIQNYSLHYTDKSNSTSSHHNITTKVIVWYTQGSASRKIVIIFQIQHGIL